MKFLSAVLAFTFLLKLRLGRNSIIHVTASFFSIILLVLKTSGQDHGEYPEGYFPFEQSPMKQPPKVRKPPYTQSNAICRGVLETNEVATQSLENLCGNLNEGFLPVNPMGQDIEGQSYPFDVIKNSTLEFFSQTLPILKEDKTLPKVAKYMSPKDRFVHSRIKPVNIRQQKFVYTPLDNNFRHRIKKRSPEDPYDSPESYSNEERQVAEKESLRQSRSLLLNSGGLTEFDKSSILEDHVALMKAQEEGRSAKSFCENNWGILCVIYNSITGRNKKTGRLQRKEDNFLSGPHPDTSLRPLTPCPSAVEYVTPVFARNYQGVWRYVVQIPYEGYFTQTVEITQCLSSTCHYLSGSCLSSPRWVSLLVAEIFYPDAIFPAVPSFRNPSLNQGGGRRGGQFAERHNQQKHQGGKTPMHCDGVDEIGCFQVRLYYDWFLVPGSCKCWKQDFYAQFALKT